MKTFKQWIVEGRSFEYGGSKYSSGFGKYTKDGSSISKEEDKYQEEKERDKYVSLLILQMIETTFGSPTEMYSFDGVELLQREIEHYKKQLIMMV